MPRKNHIGFLAWWKLLLGFSILNIFICILLLRNMEQTHSKAVPKFRLDEAPSKPVPDFLARTMHGYKRPRDVQAECSRCSDRIRGPIPTTIPEDVSQKCHWKELLHSGFADEESSSEVYQLADAKALCMKNGDDCQGVVCSNGTGKETCRLSKGRQITLADHATHMKECLLSGPCQRHHPPTASVRPEFEAAIVVVAHNRDADLAQCLLSLLKLTDVGMFNIYVSLDDAQHYSIMADVVADVARTTGHNVVTLLVAGRGVNATLDNQEQQKWFKTNTGKIAHHYWAAFEHIFMVENAKFAIFVEEDLVFAPDFLALFLSTWPVLQRDDSIWCVSGWNDVGFTFAVSDQCRLFRTSYFPGLGFMLPRYAWLKLRQQWPSAPTMGWDYWMRTAFHRLNKECIVPEVPRSRHFSQKGSSIVQDHQVEFFQSMALSSLASSCSNLSMACNHFGNLSYLMEEEYEAWISHATAASHPLKGLSVVHQTGHECTKEVVNLGIHDNPDNCAALAGLGRCTKYFMFAPGYPNWGCRCCEDVRPLGRAHAAWSLYEAHALTVLNPKQMYIFPYAREMYPHIAPVFGLTPLKMANVIPADVRSHHHGLIVARHVASQAVVLLADRRSSKPYLPSSMQVRRDSKLVPRKAERGIGCDETCSFAGLTCDAEQLYFLNNCVDMQDAFGCTYCAHQVGKELPAYVVDDFQPTVGQCLVTFISQMSCEARHPATSRLCACVAGDNSLAHL